ncbi:hypothetical protein GOODEAATRI_004217 [Goodea atripinnis]|uniref:EF-hand domain-containing protein n=1 Tax=Goodea atripinnis TaxID=208336 RepID=A0ABV0N7R2_9TELE
MRELFEPCYVKTCPVGHPPITADIMKPENSIGLHLRDCHSLEEIFRKKKARKEVADDSHRLDQQACVSPSLFLNASHKAHFSVLPALSKDGLHSFDKVFIARNSFMDNLQTEVLEIEFLSYSKGMPIISEEDFTRILLRYTNVDDVSAYMENVRHSIPDEKGISFEEFRCFFQFLNNLEDFAIAMQMYNFAHRSVGQDEFTRAVYVATGIKLSHHLVNTVFKIFDEDHDGKLSHKEFIGVMKDRLHRGDRVRYSSCSPKGETGHSPPSSVD